MPLSRVRLLVACLFMAGSSAATAVACLPDYMFDAPADAAPGADSAPSPDGPIDGADASTDTALAADADAASPVDGPLTPSVVGVGQSASCALLPDGTVQCWGSNTLASLGADEPPDAFSYVPQPVPGLTQVTAMSVGSAQVCVVIDGGVVDCWGYGGDGELGTGDISQDVPTPIKALQFEDGGTIGSVAAGSKHTCAIATDGITLWCWGYYAGTSPDNSSTAPVYLATLDAAAVEMAAGEGVTCERDVNGAVWCWGENNQGVLGQGDGLSLSSYSVTPLRIPLGTAAAQLAVGRYQVCVVTTAHDILCWGDDTLGQFGTVEPPDGGTYLASPTAIPFGGGHVTKVGCGDSHTCALYDDGGIQSWGYNYDGELGIPAPPNGQPYPVSVPNLGAATDLVVHYESACAKLVGGGVACWGNDSSGQLGAGMLPAMPIGAFPVTFP